MDWIMDAALAVAIGVAALFALVIGISAHRITRLALRRQTAAAIVRDEVPESWRVRLDTAADFLQGLGFVYRYSVAVTSGIVAEGDKRSYADIYEHEDGRTHATATPPQPPDPRRPCAITYTTLLQNGRMLVTTNGSHHHSIVRVPDVDHQDGYFPSLRKAWQFHRQRVETVKGAIVRDGVAFFRANKELLEQMLPLGEKQGVVRRNGAHWYLTWRAALAFAIQWRRGERRVAQMLAAMGAPELKAPAPVTSAAEGPAPGTLAADIEAFEKHLAVQRGLKMSTGGKWKLFLLSGLAFLAVGSLWMSWTFLPILLAVIALHEGGHFLAMKLSGYGNLSVFFVPGLGGLAAGEKPDAGPWEKLFVYLAGPLPGIALAVAGLIGMISGAFQPNPWFIEFLWVCLIVNYLNLLPITPLDGGRVVETFLFARFPTARFGFALLGFGALLAFGLWTSDKILLVIAVLVGFSLPYQWRVAQVDRAVDRGDADTVNERGAIERIFAAFQQPRFKSWNFEQRAHAATALLPELQGRRARGFEAVGGLAIYLLCLVAPLALWSAAFLPRGGLDLALAVAGVRMVPDDVDPEPADAATPPAERDWVAQAEKLDGVPEAQRLTVLLNAVDSAAVMDDEPRRERYLNAAKGLADQRPARDPERVRVLLLHADKAADDNARALAHRQVIAELEGADDGRLLSLLAEAKTNLAYTEQLPGAERVALLRDALAHQEQARAAWREKSTARLLLARALRAEQQPGEAEAQLRLRLKDIPPVASSDRSREGLVRRTAWVDAHLPLAWFLMATGRDKEASALLDGAAATIPERITISWEHPHRMVREAQVWAHVGSADTAALRAAWDRHEDARQRLPQAGSRLLSHEVDRLVVAQALRDARMEANAHEGIQAARAEPRAKWATQQLCGARERDDWRQRLNEARFKAAKAAGLCQVAS